MSETTGRIHPEYANAHMDLAATHLGYAGVFDPHDEITTGLPETETYMEDLNTAVALIRRAQHRLAETTS